MSEPTFASVVWLDAWADLNDTVSLTDAIEKHKPRRMETRGWLLADDEKGVSLFAERCLDTDDQTFRQRTFILKVLIQSITPVSEPRKRRMTRAKPRPSTNLPAENVSGVNVPDREEGR